MNQRYVLKHNEEIEKLVKKKNSVGSKYYALYFEHDGISKKIAISISKKCGSSPKRNYEKRVAREIIRIYILDQIEGFKCLLVIKKEAINLDYASKKTEIERLFKKMMEKTKERNIK